MDIEENVNSVPSDVATSLQNLTGVKFDMSGFIGEDVGAKRSEIDSVLSLAEESSGHGKKTKRQKHQVESESESESELSTSDNEEEIQAVKRKKPKKGKVHSGCHDKLSDTKLVSNEWYAHTALDEALGRKGN